jgi:hypothetical protein
VGLFFQSEKLEQYNFLEIVVLWLLFVFKENIVDPFKIWWENRFSDLNNAKIIDCNKISLYGLVEKWDADITRNKIHSVMRKKKSNLFSKTNKKKQNFPLYVLINWKEQVSRINGKLASVFLFLLCEKFL